jgi:hypothetical protein
MAGRRAGSIFESLGGWFKSSRPIWTWIYSSAILFPLLFAFVAALVLVSRRTGESDLLHRFFAFFYLILMVMLASVPRSILPALVVWLALARIRPAWDERRLIRYAGLFFLMALAVSAHALIYGKGLNLPWMLVGWLSLALPREAFPGLRGGLGRSAA